MQRRTGKKHFFGAWVIRPISTVSCAFATAGIIEAANAGQINPLFIVVVLQAGSTRILHTADRRSVHEFYQKAGHPYREGDPSNRPRQAVCDGVHPDRNRRCESLNKRGR
jgi:hypothetical protein